MQVSGYTRANGTYVAGYTRSSPRPSSGASSASSNGSVNVSGYTRSNGTQVSGYTRSAPRSGNTGSNSVTKANSTVSVSGYTRANGTEVSGYTRSTPFSTTPINVSNTDPPPTYADNPYNHKLGRVGKSLGSMPSSGKHYVDNAHNGRLGRVGKLIPPRRVKQQEIIDRLTLDDISKKLQTLGISDNMYEPTLSALEMLQQEHAEMSWKHQSIVQEATSFTDLSGVIAKRIPYSCLHEQNKIGEGTFGKVYACLWKHRPVAYKKFLHQQMSKRAKEDFVKEVEILITLNHPNIVKMFGAVVEEGNLGIVMEYMKRTLFRAILYDRSEFEEPQKKKIVSQLASALQYLHTHEREIAHCDIKSQNVLLDSDNNAKLCDFGLSVIKNVTETSRSTAISIPARGTPRYSAPEVLCGEFLSKSELFKADIYSLSIVVFEVVAEEEPFYNLNIRQLEAQVGRGNLRPTSDVAFSESLIALLKSSWDMSPRNRPSATEFTEQWSKIHNLLLPTALSIII